MENNCVICKVDKHQKRSCCQFLCCIPKHDQILIKCNYHSCSAYYHNDCLMSEILKKKDLQFKQPSDDIRPSDCLNCHKPLTIIDVPYENYEDYYNKTKLNRVIKSWFCNNTHIILYALLLVLFTTFDIFYSVKASMVVSDYNATAVNETEKKHFDNFGLIAVWIILGFVMTISYTQMLHDNTKHDFKILKGNIWLYILMLLYLSLKVGVSTLLTKQLYNVGDIIIYNDVKHLFWLSVLNIEITFVHGLLISVSTLIFGIYLGVYYIGRGIYNCPKYLCEYRQKLKTKNMRTIQIINDNSKLIKHKHKEVLNV